MRKFAIKFKLPNGQWAQGEVAALDHICALVKTTAWLSDQPVAPAEIVITDIQAQAVIPVANILKPSRP